MYVTLDRFLQASTHIIVYIGMCTTTTILLTNSSVIRCLNSDCVVEICCSRGNDSSHKRSIVLLHHIVSIFNGKEEIFNCMNEDEEEEFSVNIRGGMLFNPNIRVLSWMVM